MRLLIGWTFVVAAWVTFIGGTYNAAAWIATAFFCAAAWFVVWVLPRYMR